MFEFLTQPKYPNAAIGIEADSVTVVALQRSGQSFQIKQAAMVELAGAISPSFLETNILDVDAFAHALEDAVTGAGLLGQKRWSISLPANASRTSILTLESEPASKQETAEILDWKAEQAFGAPAAEMRISQQRISPDRDGRARFFATAVKLAVIDEYETLFERFGWKAGQILPRAVSESAWLTSSYGPSDSLLLSGQPDGFTALLMRDGEPAVVRSVTCLPSESSDEIYRLLMFYNDRFGGDAGGILERILVVGRTLLNVGVADIASEAFARPVRVLTPEDVGLELTGSPIAFDLLAAPAGLASYA